MDALQNTTIIKECELPVELSDYIQRLDYEAQGYKALAASIINNSLEFYTTENYKEYMKYYLDSDAAFRIAIQEVQHEYVPEFDGRSDILITMLYPWNRMRFHKQEVSSCENNNCKK